MWKICYGLSCLSGKLAPCERFGTFDSILFIWVFKTDDGCSRNLGEISKLVIVVEYSPAVWISKHLAWPNMRSCQLFTSCFHFTTWCRMIFHFKFSYLSLPPPTQNLWYLITNRCWVLWPHKKFLIGPKKSLLLHFSQWLDIQETPSYFIEGFFRVEMNFFCLTFE